MILTRKMGIAVAGTVSKFFPKISFTLCKQFLDFRSESIFAGPSVNIQDLLPKYFLQTFNLYM